MGKIPVFPCQTHENRVYWLTFGYLNTTIYLLRETEDGQAVLFVGKSERVPIVDRQKGEPLDRYFWEGFRSE